MSSWAFCRAISLLTDCMICCFLVSMSERSITSEHGVCVPSVVNAPWGDSWGWDEEPKNDIL